MSAAPHNKMFCYQKLPDVKYLFRIRGYIVASLFSDDNESLIIQKMNENQEKHGISSSSFKFQDRELDSNSPDAWLSEHWIVLLSFPRKGAFVQTALSRALTSTRYTCARGMKGLSLEWEMVGVDGLSSWLGELWVIILMLSGNSFDWICRLLQASRCVIANRSIGFSWGQQTEPSLLTLIFQIVVRTRWNSPQSFNYQFNECFDFTWKITLPTLQSSGLECHDSVFN